MKQLFKNSTLGVDLAGIILVNYFLNLVTFGLHIPWGRVRLRRYLWNNIQLDGQSLTYDGNGRELIFGFIVSLLGIGALVVWGITLILAGGKGGADALLAVFLILPFVFFILPVLRYRGMRYLASRTQLRGIHFSLDGSAAAFAFRCAILGVAVVCTAGLLYPYFRLELQRRTLGRIKYGSEAVDVGGSAFDLIGPWLLALVLSAPTASLSLFWYHAYELRYVVSKTAFQNADFALGASTLDLFILRLVNTLLLVFTLGLAYPWTLARKLRFWSEDLSMTGDVDYARISQSEAAKSSVGDGLFSAVPV